MNIRPNVNVNPDPTHKKPPIPPAPPPVATINNTENLTLLERVEALERGFARVILAAGNTVMHAPSDRHPATAIFGENGK